jgi:hypothetical protein
LLEPFAVRHFGFGRESVGQQAKLTGGDVAATGAIKQVREKLRGRLWRPMRGMAIRRKTRA